MVTPTAIIIDDEPDIGELFSSLLELLNVKVVGIGHTGFDAIRLVNAENPDLVFLDINMPKMDGIKALKKIKKNNPTTKVIMMTSDQRVDEKKLSWCGAYAIIFKPFNMGQIKQVFEKIKESDHLGTLKA